MENNLFIAFLLTFLAGISTLLGGILSFFIGKNNYKLLALGLGFSAGVMIYVSFSEILPKAQESLSLLLDEKMAEWTTLTAFFAGITIAALADKLLPEDINQDKISIGDDFEKQNKKFKLKRMGLFVALAVTIHNFPEGLATFMAALSDPALGISIAIAIAIHNIPEGIAVAMPIYNATGDKAQALGYAALSGLAEPLGAVLGYFLLSFLFNDFTFGVLFAAVGGIMVYISFDELLPSAREYGNPHIEILGVSLGMLVMGISLILL